MEITLGILFVLIVLFLYIVFRVLIDIVTHFEEWF